MPVDIFFKFYVIFVQKNKIWEQTKHFEKVLVKKKNCLPPANYLCEIHSENKLYQRTMKLKLGYGDMHEYAHVTSMVNEPRLYGNRKTGLITKT